MTYFKQERVAINAVIALQLSTFQTSLLGDKQGRPLTALVVVFNQHAVENSANIQSWVLALLYSKRFLKTDADFN